MSGDNADDTNTTMSADNAEDTTKVKIMPFENAVNTIKTMLADNAEDTTKVKTMLSDNAEDAIKAMLSDNADGITETEHAITEDTIKCISVENFLDEKITEISSPLKTVTLKRPADYDSSAEQEGNAKKFQCVDKFVKGLTETSGSSKKTFEALSVEANENPAGYKIDNMPSTSSVNEILQPEESSGLEKPPIEASDSSVNYKAEPEHPLVEEDAIPVHPEHPFAEEDKSLSEPDIMEILEDPPIEPLSAPVTMIPFMVQLAEPSGSYNVQVNRYLHMEPNSNLVLFTGGSNQQLPSTSALTYQQMASSSAFNQQDMPSTSASTSYNASIRYAAGTADDPIVLE